MGPTVQTPTGRGTFVGNLDAEQLTVVDERGLVSIEGATWSLDWWIGAEDRWHVPADEASVRQAQLGSSPVVETRMRVPSGDAVQRVYGARDAAGAEVVVVEVENETKIPFAVALAVVPARDGGSIREISAEGTEVRVDGALALVAGRAPGRRTALPGSVAEVVLEGRAAPEAAVAASAADGRAEAALVFPLAHSATLRVVLPLDGGPIDVTAVPSAEQVVSGWQTHARRGARIVVPDRRLQGVVDRTLRQLLLRPVGVGAAAALDRFGFAPEAGRSLLDAVDDVDEPGTALLAIADHWSFTLDVEFALAAVDAVAALIAALARVRSPEDLARGAAATEGAAALLIAARQARGAKDVRAAGAALAARAEGAAPSIGDVGEGPALLLEARDRLVREEDDPDPVVALCPVVPDTWLGQGWEVHDLPTRQGSLSYAVRWHGERPALLWELERGERVGTVRLTAPGLDPTWSSDDGRGEALLAAVALPPPPERKGLTIPVTIEPRPPRP